MSSYFQWAVIAFVVLSILWHTWKGGAANPIGTGRLQRDLAKIKSDVAALSEGTRKAAKASDLAHLKQDMERNQGERTQAMSDLNAKIEKVADEVDAFKGGVIDRLAKVEANTEATANQVNMIYRVIVPRGMS